MKFAKLLARNIALSSPAWADHFISYKALKKILATRATPLTVAASNNASLAAVLAACPEEVTFFGRLQEELVKVSSFFDSAEAALAASYAALVEAFKSHGVAMCESSNAAMDAQIESTLALLAQCAQFYSRGLALQNFGCINSVGFSKALKKHDKLRRVATRDAFLSRCVYTRPFAHCGRTLAMLAGAEAIFRVLLAALPPEVLRGAGAAAGKPLPAGLGEEEAGRLADLRAMESSVRLKLQRTRDGEAAAVSPSPASGAGAAAVGFQVGARTAALLVSAAAAACDCGSLGRYKSGSSSCPCCSRSAATTAATGAPSSSVAPPASQAGLVLGRRSREADFEVQTASASLSAAAAGAMAEESGGALPPAAKRRRGDEEPDGDDDHDGGGAQMASFESAGCGCASASASSAAMAADRHDDDDDSSDDEAAAGADSGGGGSAGGGASSSADSALGSGAAGAGGLSRAGSAPGSMRRSESSSLLQLAQLVMRESGEALPDADSGSGSSVGGAAALAIATAAASLER